MSIRPLTTRWMVPFTKLVKSKRFGKGERKFISLKYQCDILEALGLW